MKNRTEIIDSVMATLWSASCELWSLSRAGQGQQAKRLRKVIGELQALQNDIPMAEIRAAGYVKPKRKG